MNVEPSLMQGISAIVMSKAILCVAYGIVHVFPLHSAQRDVSVRPIG
jgi:hypothetical protein